MLAVLLPPLDEIKDELEARGPEIVWKVIARLRRFQDTQYGYYPWSVKKDYWEVFLLLSVILENARPKHARTLAGMLSWESMVGMSYGGMIVETLEKIGNSSVVRLLREHRRMLKAFYRKNPSSDRESEKETPTARSYRLKGIKRAIKACDQRE